MADSSTKVFGYHINYRLYDREGLSYPGLSMNYAAMNRTTSYWRSVYWAMSCMSSIAFPDIITKNPVETIYCCVVMFFGCPALNMLVGGIAAMIGSFKREKKECYANLEKITELIRYKEIPRQIEDKIKRRVVSVLSFLLLRDLPSNPTHSLSFTAVMTSHPKEVISSKHHNAHRHKFKVARYMSINTASYRLHTHFS